MFSFAGGHGSLGSDQVDTTIAYPSVAVPLSFPMANTSFDGGDRWLEIAVRPSLAGSNYVRLFPRHQITAAPYSMKAAQAGAVPGLRANSSAGSIALGFNTTASGASSTSAGLETTASGFGATAMGLFGTASVVGSVGMGYFASAAGDYSVALGSSVFANAPYSMAAGHWATANHSESFVWAGNHAVTFASTSNPDVGLHK